MIRQCSGTKRDGSQCTATVNPPQTLCWWHNPANQEKRQKAASKGGKAKANRVTKELHETLEDVTRRVISGQLKPYLGMSISQLVATRIALLRFEKDLAEQQEIVERLDRLEEIADQASLRRTG